jgi:hypothetical protein
MAFESLLEFIPSDSMPDLLHGLEMLPPQQGLTSKLQGGDVGLVFHPAW